MNKTEKTKELFDFDAGYNAQFLCGADEAGRGPLAGPVVCAACIMPRDSFLAGVNDSKKVSEPERERLYTLIVNTAVSYRIEIIDNRVIDEINILQATKRGMERAILGLTVCPDVILVDAVAGLKIGRAYDAIIKGDAKSYAVAAASILAKVTRDRIMRDAALQYPAYGFERHKGYGTAAHIAALNQFGKTPLHRETFIRHFSVKSFDDGEAADG